jgi:REP element-mobilizing transposase RayT
VGERARELLREIARANEITIYAGAINRDHVHMLISIPGDVPAIVEKGRAALLALSR